MFGQRLVYFIPEGKMSGLTENSFGCQMGAELLVESRLCLTETIENGKHIET